MSANESRTIADVFNLLDRWRHLPAYRLESRVAPFFALFLRDVLSARFGVELHDIVISEFPLRIGTLYPKGESPPSRSEEKRQSWRNLSYNVDYVAFGEDRNKVFLVELKTDRGSQRKEQEKYLRCAQRVGLRRLVDGIVEICKATDKKPKYVHLLHILSKLSLVLIPSDTELYKKTFPTGKSGWNDAFCEVEPTVHDKFKSIELVYILPREPEKIESDFNYIYFDEVADTVQQRGELGCIFANYLRQWTSSAGSRHPRGTANNMLRPH